MILGLDLYGTITEYPQRLRELVYAVKADGGEVWVISAVKPGNEDKAFRDAGKYNFDLDGVRVVRCSSYHEAPMKKYEVCVELGVQLMLDDRKDIVDYLNKRHVLALLVP
jgi:hypothetical protein